jgi:hypothetical protein
VKEQLLQLMKDNPATAGRPDDFLDTLAEDILAVIVRAIALGDPSDPLVEIEHRVEDVWVSQFGVSLFNLFGMELFPGKKELPFSARKRVVEAMIQAMLLEQDEVPSGIEADAFQYSEARSELMKCRLAELADKPVYLN